MADLDYSDHARVVLQERAISEEWVERATAFPDRCDSGPDGNVHYLKAIPERDGRVLRVVVNPRGSRARIVTAFFDRRARGQL